MKCPPDYHFVSHQIIFQLSRGGNCSPVGNSVHVSEESVWGCGCSFVCVWECVGVCYCLVSKSVQLMSIWARGNRRSRGTEGWRECVKQSRGSVRSGGKKAEGRRVGLGSQGVKRLESHSGTSPPGMDGSFLLLKISGFLSFFTTLISIWAPWLPGHVWWRTNCDIYY